MPREIDDFAPADRGTELPYRDWLTGKILELDYFEDLRNHDPVKVANALRSYAKRRGMAVVAVPVRDRSAPGKPFTSLQVWGDPSRSWAEGPTDEIAAKLEAAGHRLRRQAVR